MNIKYRHLNLFLMSILLFIRFSLNGQNFPSMLAGGNQVISMGINSDPILNANFDYGFRNEKVKLAQTPLLFMAQVNMPLFTNRGFDIDVKLGAGSLISINNSFKAIVGMSLVFSRTSDINANYFNVGYKLDLYPGYHCKQWMVSPHLSWQYNPNVFIRHKEYSKSAFNNLYTQGSSGPYTSPRNGWFRQNGHTLKIGLSVSFYKPSWSINLAGGLLYIPNKLGILMFPDIGIMPFYGGLNFTHSVN